MSIHEDDRYLPGGPSNLLVRRVRSSLALYRIRPCRETWRLTWEWANAIANSYWSTTRKHWPLATEIATQYVVLMLARMRDEERLRLPFRANKMPQRVAEALRLADSGKPFLPQLCLKSDEGQGAAVQ